MQSFIKLSISIILSTSILSIQAFSADNKKMIKNFEKRIEIFKKFRKKFHKIKRYKKHIRKSRKNINKDK